ncbi:Lrp/AsnC family transcriptional regulator [Arthrobacter sp. FW306-05-C]|uniref:Lrp/AsnC family transcriptional regulator n=1 Tax=Arthrobacter TaxID=1663 RepID=UPI001EEF9ABF|nr:MULTISPECIES: Lrp/AsnC family transcriptional regulator [Arthrobacter]MDP9989166.1 DNA-binding Lrp family transcriptional regulator [Arthrobacter oryzae]UKA66361.1 Lrp/AsnC family transcriptional regulator [Arthrobacter sp. FW306-05-C]UKA75014.1 Lrp/AsnC family transcriptional regulator [Arthrobacter sp. FW306-07-I]
MELSEDDLALIQVLQASPRLGWADAAKVLGVHATTLAARWDRLTSNGAAWVTAHLAGDPKQMLLAYVAVDCEMNLRDSVTAELAAVPEIVTVEESASNRDLMLTVITRSLEEFSAKIITRLKAVEGLTKYQVALCTRLHSSGDDWRLNVLSRAQLATLRTLASPPAPDSTQAAQLPQNHLDLLPFLARDGRATAADIARSLGRHPATVQRQLNRVLASGILSFRCEIAQAYSSFPVTCQWFVNVPAGQHDAAAAQIRTISNVRLSASTTGPTNFVIIMWLQTLADVMSAELALQQKVPGIDIVESAVMLRTVKRVGWMLKEDTTASGAVVHAGNLGAAD